MPARQLGKTISSVKIQGKHVILQSSAFAFVVDTSAGLRTVSWKNRLTGRTLSLGNGAEVEFDIGLPENPLQTPTLRVVKMPAALESAGGIEAVFELEADDPKASVTVVYRWDEKQLVLRKFVTITNRSGTEWNRLLNVRLGVYRTDANLSGGELEVYPPSFKDRAHRFGGLQGFPVYADGEFFLSLAHPAGWATQKPGEISLRHYPGTKVLPGASRTCMEVVYGASPAGKGHESFVAHIRSRMRRVLRGHDKPYAIFEPFGARSDGKNESVGIFNETEEFLLDMIGKVAEGQRNSNCRFDFFSLDFWHDNRGDIKLADPVRFPNQFETIKATLRREDIKPGLWIDSSHCGWSIGGNPTTHPAIAQPVGQDFGNLDISVQQQFWFCRATEPIHFMYTEGFRHHIRENGVRLLKFDNFASQCSNPKHDHLPGPYANEATHDGVIACYQALDKECPDVFIMLYWGYRSPWWLLFADTMFETGMEMEAASPGHMPAPFIRDGITRKLDQGHVYAKDVPWLGTDSLGVWLSHWGAWNSGVGPERWQEGFMMDICRGHALAQPWSDPQWLTPAERRQMGELIALMKAQPQCFTNSRLILGDPWKYEPYGYCCTDGKRAFLAINNGTWEDRMVKLRLNATWGLPNGKTWDLYRWYPDPARLTGDGKTFGDEALIALRPFEVVLLEAVPSSESPALPRNFKQQPLPVGFSEASRPVKLTVTREKPPETLMKNFSCSGNFALPSKCMVFAPFTKEDGVPEEELFRRVPAVLELEGKRAAGIPASFDADRILDLASFIGGSGAEASGKCAFVYIPFTSKDAGPATFGFGADWWYEAYLDGKLISETLTRGGNKKLPPNIGNYTATVDLKQGDHLLVLRFLRGSASAQLTVGGPLDLDAAIKAPCQHIKGEIPASQSGGLLVVVAELSRDGAPVELGDFGSFFTTEAAVVGVSVTFRPALGPQGYPSSWQALRYEVVPNSSPQLFELWITASLGLQKTQVRFTAHFLPDQKEENRSAKVKP